MKWRIFGEFYPKTMYNFQIQGVTARVPLSSLVIRTSFSVIKYSLPFLSLSTLRSAGSTPFKVEALAATLAVRANISMASADGAPEADGAGEENSSGELSHFQRLVAEDRSGGWEKCWELGITGWDLGGPTPVVVHLSETGSLPNGRALVPGCGTGYDVVAMACPDRHVVGLDISKTAVERATKIFSSLPNSKYYSFLNEDFFTWQPAEQFDLIFDYTFFCAFEPHVRPLWAKRMQELLKPGGELITLMFPMDDRTGGPPFSASVSDYKEILIPLGFEAVSIVDNELAVGPRKGSEKLGRWKQSSVQSAM